MSAVGYSAEIYKTYSTKVAKLGTPLDFPDGRSFRFALNGAVDLPAARLVQAAGPPDSNHLNQNVAAAVAAGDLVITVTIGATAIVADEFADGYVYVNDAGADTTTEGYLYRIKTHPACAASGTLTLTLYEDSPVHIALTTNSQVTLYHSDYYKTIIHPSPPTASLAGVTPTAVLAGKYYWCQVKGTACVLTEGTLVQARSCMASGTTDGAVTPLVLTEATPNTELQAVVGLVKVVNVTTEESLIDLRLPG